MDYCFDYCIQSCLDHRSGLFCDHIQVNIDKSYYYFGMMHYSDYYYSIDCNHQSVNNWSDAIGNGYWYYNNFDVDFDIDSDIDFYF